MKKLLIVFAALTLVVTFMSPALAVDCNSAILTPKEAVQCGVNGANGGQTQTPNQAGTSLTGTLETVLNIFSLVVGFLAVIMIIIAGFRYITSGGAQDKVKGAKDTILYAIVGIVIVALAQVIVQFVLNRAANPTAASSTGANGTCTQTPYGYYWSGGSNNGKPCTP